MPLIDVRHDHTVSTVTLQRLAELLPSVVAEAVDCVEEPWHGDPGVGDIEIRFQPKGAHDTGALRCTVEIRTKRFPSRTSTAQARADLVRDRLAGELDVAPLGVWLVLLDGAWSQT